MDPTTLNLLPVLTHVFFMGYPLHQHGYKYYDPPSRKYFVSMDVTFLEDKPFFPVSHIQGKSGSEEANWPIPFVYGPY